MRYLLLLLILFFSSCRMDSCIDRGVEQGMSRSEAKEACEEGRDNSYKR